MSENATSGPIPSPVPALRLGREDGPNQRGERPVRWQLRRDGAFAASRVFAACGLAALGCAAAAGFLRPGGTTQGLALGLAALGLLGVALLQQLRHAGDSESIRLQDGRLTVEQNCGARTLRVDFQPDWVRVEPEVGDGSLVELSGRGRRVVVGRFVRPELRRQLADEIRWALRRRPASAGARTA
jgi:uncharacterized membrane protein